MARHHGTTNTTLRKIARDIELADLRDGRRNRAATYTDRKKHADKTACRRRINPNNY